MTEKWLVVGISGVTCGGKTTLATELNKIFPSSRLVSQDDYFLDVDDPRHTWVPELNHINFDVLSSLDMEKMHVDVQAILKKNIKRHENGHKFQTLNLAGISRNELQKITNLKLKSSALKLLIIEGFSIFNYRPIESFCTIKYFFTLEKDECFLRRSNRVYEPPDCPGYFEMCAWPEYLKHLEDVQVNVKNVKYFNELTADPVTDVLLGIVQTL